MPKPCRFPPGACPEPVDARGLCKRHYGWCRRYGLLDRYALPAHGHVEARPLEAPATRAMLFPLRACGCREGGRHRADCPLADVEREGLAGRTIRDVPEMWVRYLAEKAAKDRARDGAALVKVREREAWV